MNLKGEIEKFLKNTGYLPLSRWKTFEVEHGNEKEEKQILAEIKNHVGSRPGLYLYKKDGKILYIGKAKLLKDRLKSHCRESYKPVSGDRKSGQTFHDYFSAKRNCGRLEVFWIEAAIEDERIILEAMLQYILNPEFR